MNEDNCASEDQPLEEQKVEEDSRTTVSRDKYRRLKKKHLALREEYLKVVSNWEYTNN